MLLGADVYAHIILSGVKKGGKGSPIAQQTELGWILSGPCSTTERATSIAVRNFNLKICIDDQLKRFWEMEDVGTVKIMTEEEKYCEKHFVETHKRNKAGRYIVALPTYDIDSLGKSRDQAIARLKQMEKNFQKNASLHDKYVEFMNEYIRLGHMEIMQGDS